MTSEQVRVGGVWLASIASVFGIGDLKYSFTADGDCEQASWSMNLSPSFSHSAVVSGALVEIRVGPSNIWSGVLDEPDSTDDGGWSFSAAGFGAEVRDWICFDADLNTTSTPDVAIDGAIARSQFADFLSRPESLSAASFAVGEETAALNRVGDLLDSWGRSVSKRWGVDPDGRVYAASDPTEPTWYLTAGSGQVGIAGDDYASDLFGRYQVDASTYATATVSDPAASAAHRREYPVDLTSLGYIDEAKAVSVLGGLLAEGKARYAWTKALTVSRLQLTTPGGTPAFLPFVRAGQMVRLFGVPDPQSLRPHLDFVLGRTEYVAGANVITLSPVNLAARNLGDVLSLAVES